MCLTLEKRILIQDKQLPTRIRVLYWSTTKYFKLGKYWIHTSQLIEKSTFTELKANKVEKGIEKVTVKEEKEGRRGRKI